MIKRRLESADPLIWKKPKCRWENSEKRTRKKSWLCANFEKFRGLEAISHTHTHPPRIYIANVANFGRVKLFQGLVLQGVRDRQKSLQNSSKRYIMYRSQCDVISKIHTLLTRVIGCANFVKFSCSYSPLHSSASRQVVTFPPPPDDAPPTHLGVRRRRPLVCSPIIWNKCHRNILVLLLYCSNTEMHCIKLFLALASNECFYVG